MARKALIVRAQRKPKFSTRKVNRCRCCGRPRGYIRRFEMCRICFRDLASPGTHTRRDEVELVVPWV